MKRAHLSYLIPTALIAWTAAAVAQDAAELPDDASPETIPFTGLQLAYLAGLGLIAATGGLAVRRMARR